MGNAAVIFICLAILASAAWMMIRADEAKDSRLLTELNYLKGKHKLLQKQVNEMNTRVYDNGKSLTEHIDKTKSSFISVKKKVNDIEFHVMKPRAINVTMMKPVEVKDVTPPLLKEVSRKKPRRVTKKKVTKKKSKKKSSKKSRSRSRGSK